MDKNNHNHEWDENLECKCGVKFGPPETKKHIYNYINNHVNTLGLPPTPTPPLATKDKPAIQIIVELRNKITKALDEAMEEILEEEKK